MIKSFSYLFLLFPFAVFTQQKEILHREYFSNGNLLNEGWYKNNQKNSFWKFYSNNYTLLACGAFKNNKKYGYWHFFSETGIPLKKDNFIKGKIK